MTVSRRRALALLGGAAATWIAPRRASSAERRPVKVGFIAPFTGPFAQNAKDMWDGFRLYFEEIGMNAAGRRIELIAEDSWVEPAGALTKLRKLVEKDGVDVAAGGLLSPTGLALQPYVHAQKIPFVITVSADDITQRKITPWYIRTHWSGSQVTHPLGDYAFKVLGHRRVAGINFDFSLGHEALGGFQRVFEELGGRVIQKLWAPTNVADFAPYLAQVKRDADAIFATFSGAAALRFLKQAVEYGVKGKIPIIGHGLLTDEHVLPSMGDEALGVVTTLSYSAALDTPGNRIHRPAFQKFTGRIPSLQSTYTYTAARWIVEGLKAVGGEVENREKYLAALKRVEISDDPRGPIKIDQLGNPIQNIYVRRVERLGGQLQNTVIFTYPEVSQFWVYKPEDFLKNPVYDRDNYPGCKYCL